MSKRLDILLRIQRGLDKTIRDGAAMQGGPAGDRYMLATTLEQACEMRAAVAVEKAKITSREDFEQ